jgi:acyl carrier protein
MTTLQIVQQMLAEELARDVSEFDAAKPLEELGVDSLAVIEFMFKLEDRFHIRMTDERAPIRTIQDIADGVDRLIAEQRPRAGVA